jgi:hypothetical protein
MTAATFALLIDGSTVEIRAAGPTDAVDAHRAHKHAVNASSPLLPTTSRSASLDSSTST